MKLASYIKKNYVIPIRTSRLLLKQAKKEWEKRTINPWSHWIDEGEKNIMATRCMHKHTFIYHLYSIFDVMT